MRLTHIVLTTTTGSEKNSSVYAVYLSSVLLYCTKIDSASSILRTFKKFYVLWRKLEFLHSRVKNTLLHTTCVHFNSFHSLLTKYLKLLANMLGNVHSGKTQSLMISKPLIVMKCGDFWRFSRNLQKKKRMYFWILCLQNTRWTAPFLFELF